MAGTRHPFDLEQRTLMFARSVVTLCRQIRQDAITRELISQLVRASGSVGANYREANDALSKKDFGHRIRIARREAKEAYYWLELLQTAVPESDGQMRTVLQEALELKKILSAIAEKAV